MTSIFKKYSSIENSYQSRFVSKCIDVLDGYDEFVVQEKIHGANFSFHVTETDVKCAKRTDFIHDGESFFDYKKVLSDNLHSLRILRQRIGKDFIIYGELFGKGVQKEVYYCEDKRFYAFSIFIIGEDYLSAEESELWFKTSGFLYAKILFKGTLSECFSFDIDRNSILQTEIDDTVFGPGENIMEGVVILPNEPKYIGDSRIIFKKKTEKFSEKKAPDKIKSDPREFQEYDVYITRPRLDNIISKNGEITDKKDLPKYAELLVQDILEDILKDSEELQLEPKEIPRDYIFKKSIKFILSELF